MGDGEGGEEETQRVGESVSAHLREEPRGGRQPQPEHQPRQPPQTPLHPSAAPRRGPRPGRGLPGRVHGPPDLHGEGGMRGPWGGPGLEHLAS